jgi:DNA-binding NarL/FixJ family response regulator
MIDDTHLMKFYIDLTPRQRQVLQLVCKGLRNRDIAQRLNITSASWRNT